VSPKRSSRSRSGAPRNRRPPPASPQRPPTSPPTPRENPAAEAGAKPAAATTAAEDHGAEQGWLTRKLDAVPVRVREVALVVSGAVVSLWAALLLSVVGAFLTPLRIGTVQVPVSIVLSVGGNALIMWFAYRVTRSKGLTLLPGLLWVGLTFLASGTTSERDVVLLGNWVAIAYLYSGCATITVIAYRLLVPRRPRSS